MTIRFDGIDLMKSEAVLEQLILESWRLNFRQDVMHVKQFGR